MTILPIFSTPLALLQGQAQNPLMGLIVPVGIAAVFYLLFFLPMQRQKKKTAEMLKSLQPGNVVVTTGGIMGTIVSTQEDIVVLKVKPDNIKIQVARHAVSGIVPEEEVKKY